LAAALVLLALTATATLAQSPPMKWGDVPDEHVAMMDFPADSNATAVILGDYGSVEFTRRGMEMVVHRRIKLLDEAAYDEYGTLVLYFNDEFQDLRHLKAQTIVPREGGGYDRVKVEKNSIFEEEVGENVESRRLTFPALEPGAIVEYEYRLSTERFFFVPEWTFQDNEPTLWSEFRFLQPEYLAYTFMAYNVPEFHVREQKELTRPSGNSTLYRWVMKDVPAIRDEPFMTTVADYTAKLDGQIAQYLSGGRVEDVSRSWPAVEEELADNEYFGKAMKPTRQIRRLSESLTEGLETPREKIEALYDYVRTQIEWQGRRGYFVEEDLDRVLETKQGDRGDKPILLIALARAADIEANPVLISTRDHGQIREFYPIRAQFNQLLVHVDLGEETVLLDPNASSAPFGMLGPLSVNGKGLLMKGAAYPEWIPIQTDIAYRHMIALTGAIGEDGSFAGTLVASESGYSALIKRNQYEDADDDASFVRDVYLSDSPEATVSDIEIANAEEVDETFRAQAQIVLPGSAQAAGEFMYIFPVQLDRTEENPLRSPTRSFPVDLGYKRDVIYQMTMEIPDGYVVSDLPRPMRAGVQGGGGMFTRRIAEQDGSIVVQFRFRLMRPVFEPMQYDALRGFYDAYIAALDEPIVLMRGEAEPPATAAPAQDEPAEGSGERSGEGGGDDGLK
jgi:transglutaminase-like putative cysteine protease